MILTPHHLDRISAALKALEDIEANTGVTVSDAYGPTYLKVDGQMIRFHEKDGQYILVGDDS